MRPGKRRLMPPIRTRRGPGSESGVTLIEVLTAFSILLLALIPLTYLLDNQVGQASQSRNRITALSIAETAVETLSNYTEPANAYGELVTDTPSAPTGGLPATQTLSGVTYATSVEYSWAAWQHPTASKPDMCTAGTPQLLKLTVTVSWGPNLQMQDSVLVDYPPAGIQTLGFLAFQISGDSSTPDFAGRSWTTRVQTIPVTLTETTAGTGQTLPLQTITGLTPDAYGCVFAEVVPGTWTVSAASPAGLSPVYTTEAAPQAGIPQLADQTTPPSISGNVVSVGTTTPVAATWDQGTLLDLTYPSSTSVEDGVLCPGAPGFTCLASGEGPSGATLAWPTNTTDPGPGTTWSQAAAPGNLSRLTSLACTSTASPAMSKCIGVGYGLAGGVVTARVIAGSSPAAMASNPNDLLPAGITALSQVVCPPSGPSDTHGTCVAIGSTPSGAVILAGTITAATDTWQAEPLGTGVTVGTLTQVSCASTTACVAVGTTGGAAVAVSGSAAAGSTWVAGTPPTGVALTSLSRVVCPAANACMALGTGTVGAGPAGPLVLSGVPTVPASGLAGGVTWTDDAIPATDTLTSLSQVVCPSATRCLVTGSGTVQGTVAASIMTGPAAGGALIDDAVPHSPTIPLVLNQLTCPSASVCVADGASASGPVSISGLLGTPDAWVSDTVPPTVTTLTQLTCPTSTQCLTAGSGPTGGALLQGAVTTGGSTVTAVWTAVGLPAAGTLQYVDGLACVARPSSYCAAVGATTTSAVLLGSVMGSPATWSLDQTPGGLSGLSTQGVPLQLDYGIKYATENAGGGGSDLGQVGPVFPLSGGYSLFAGDCQAELGTANATPVVTQPGASPAVTVPLGVLAVSVVVASTGQPAGAATLTLTATTPGCAADSYHLQTTGPDGLSRTQVPYGTYSMVATNAAGANASPVAVTVGPNSVAGPAGTVALPSPIAVAVP